MKIQILGTGCAKCKKLEENAKQAVNKLHLDAQVEKIEDLDQIMNMGVMMTPALAFDGTVKSAGKLLSVDEIIKLLGG
ncbi:MAG TPA: thioredoxin family protein [Spirochaetia bacterium]|nr:MAG: redox-active disulfide protein 2 [Spirochaetes bacterium GWB1_36_13]HCL55932.1 thioredoxin family protein [Spirochaetia bacterium]